MKTVGKIQKKEVKMRRKGLIMGGEVGVMEIKELGFDIFFDFYIFVEEELELIN